MYQTASDERIIASVQTAVNKIHSIQRYFIWMHDEEPEESAEILKAARREIVKGHTLDYSLEAAFEYSDKWEQFHYLLRDVVRAATRERELELGIWS